MKRLIILAVSIFALSLAVPASADQISFIWDTSTGETLQGVDGNTSGWSNGGSNLVNLGTSNWSLLGGTAGVVADDGKILTQQGPRGLGIAGGDDWEIDSYNGVEKLEINFNQPTYLNSFEVRSLFHENGHNEEGEASFLLGGNNIFTQHLVGVENLATPGTNGVVDYSYAQPYLIDKIVFDVPAGQSYTSWSEFDVAKLNVTAVPEPVSTVLFLTGIVPLAVRKLRRK